MQIHSNATTNVQQRLFIQNSSESCRSLATQFMVSPATICRWKRREDQQDHSCRPSLIHYAFSLAEERFILFLRRKGLSLDDLADAVARVLPDATRASIHRLLTRKGVSRLPKYSRQDREPSGKFKDYLPGYLHIDCFYLPRVEGRKRYCFVAVDRATRLVYLHVYEHVDAASAVNFLGRCLSFYPFLIKKILTDNGAEFSLGSFRRWGRPAKRIHLFDQICAACGIEHRLTRPYTPKTNGLAERTNGLIQEGTYKKHPYSSQPEMEAGLHSWMLIYNLVRPNRRIGRKTPYQAVCDWYGKHPELFIKEPAHLRTFLFTNR